MKFFNIFVGFVLIALSTGTFSQTTYVTDTGRYYWELLFSYDNTTNTGNIEEEISYRIEKVINSSQFRETTLSSKQVYQYKGTANIGVKFSIFEIGGSSESSVAYEAHQQLIERLTETTNFNESYERKRRYTITGGSTLELYRLVYVSSGIVVKTDTVSTKPKDQIKVDIQYTVEDSMPGVIELLDLLQTIVPNKDNKNEWSQIRASIVSASHKDSTEQFLNLANTFRTIYPRKENKKEWAAIRTTCNEIINDWDSKISADLFVKLLTRLASTYPSSANKSEWARIREVSVSIRDKMRVIR